MPPMIQTPLPVIAFSKNTLWLKLQSDDFRGAVPAASVNALEFPAAVAPGAVAGISWTGGAATMTAAAVPDDTGFQFPSGDGGWAYVQTLVAYFAGNSFIDRGYLVAADNAGAYPRLLFTSREKSSDYDFIAAANITNVTPGVTDATKENFRHHLQITIGSADGTGFNTCFDANVPLDEPTAGLTSVDIHEALHAFLSPDYPELNAAYSRCLNSIRPYTIKYAQYYGAAPFIRRVLTSDWYFIAMGGLSVQQSVLRDLSAELCPNPADKTTWKFLRQGDKNKLVRRDQPEWLTWLNLTGDAQIQLEIYVKNDDNTDLTFTTSGLVAAAAYSKYQFQSGFTQLGITGLQSAAKKPVYYTARLKNADGYLSAPYTYVIDYNYQEWPRYFVYFNSLGGYQTICTVGKQQNEFDRTADNAQLAVNRLTAALNGEFLETNITIQDKATVNIGYKRSGERNLDLMRDFFSSRSIFLFDAGTLIPIEILSKNLKDAPDGSNVYGSSFDYAPKYQEETFTESAGLADTDLNELLTVAGIPVAYTPPAGATVPAGGVIRVIYADPHLTVLAGRQVYTAPLYLAGRTGYAVYSSQLGRCFFAEELSYDSTAGSFTILVDGFLLQLGDYLLIWPLVVDPDGLFT